MSDPEMEKLHKLETQVDRMERSLGIRNRSEMHFIVNSGGWVAGVACAIAASCLAVALALAFQQQKTDTRQDADIADQRAQQRRDDDYRNMLWRAYPELREAAIKAHEERQNGKPDRH